MCAHHREDRQQEGCSREIPRQGNKVGQLTLTDLAQILNTHLFEMQATVAPSIGFLMELASILNNCV